MYGSLEHKDRRSLTSHFETKLNEIFNALQIIYGNDKINRDWTRQQMKFAPMPAINVNGIHRIEV